MLRARTVTVGGLDIAGEPGEPVQPNPSDIAFIQYSSGSTGDPKGVMLTHRNLTINTAQLAAGAGYTDRDSVLSWMPLSHDMGLIGFHLTLLSAGASHAIMRTELFARRPLLWLELASQRRSTVLCSPNFGFQHYLRQYAIKSPQGLDPDDHERRRAHLGRRVPPFRQHHGAARPEAAHHVHRLRPGRSDPRGERSPPRSAD